MKLNSRKNKIGGGKTPGVGFFVIGDLGKNSGVFPGNTAGQRAVEMGILPFPGDKTLQKRTVRRARGILGGHFLWD
ncbi:hypothetical protein SDC9_180170 [bioreactor metagenome]|uniref:Uncharacterized protein n=1 Tax=bioreactor metagenome TaxID=1076179 RepID=A0A645H201_9ZZZZ